MADTKFMSFAEATPVGTDSVLIGNSTNGVRRAQLSNLKAVIGDIVEESLGLNGYIKYASGLIVQWGSVDMTQQATTKTVELPVSFPNRGITGCAGSLDVNRVSPCGVSVSKTSITISTTTASSWTNWFAIGY